MDKEKIKEARKTLGLTQTELGEKLGAKLRTVQSWESGDRNISQSAQLVLSQLLRNHNKNTSDISVNDVFEQYAVSSKNGHQTFNMPDGSYMMKVPLVPIKAYARYISEGDSAEYLEGEQEYAYFRVDRVGKGNYRSFQIKGDSFWNEGGFDTPDKAIALGRELDKSHWKDGFRDSELGWIIVTNENIVIKDIIAQDLQKGEIICHSRNPSKEYSDFPLSLDHEVKSIWRVIKRQF